MTEVQDGVDCLENVEYCSFGRLMKKKEGEDDQAKEGDKGEPTVACYRP
jgi:hypothetical protein